MTSNGKKIIMVTGGAGFISAGCLGILRSCQRHSSDINFDIEREWRKQIDL